MRRITYLVNKYHFEEVQTLRWDSKQDFNPLALTYGKYNGKVAWGPFYNSPLQHKYSFMHNRVHHKHFFIYYIEYQTKM